MQRAAKVFAVDTTRIHIGGFSQGGFITFNFLCDPQKANLIASAAPQAATPRTGNVTCFGPAASDAVNPDVPFVFTSGRNDRVVDFQGQQAAQQAIVRSLQPVRSMQVIDQGPNGFMRTRVVGNDGRTVDLILHDGTNPRLGGHCFVGADSDDGGGCTAPNACMNGEVTFSFFKNNPRNPMRPAVQLPN
jgi:dienelactone hydrolase